MKIGQIVTATESFTPIDTYESVNGCGDDMCDCSDYEQSIGPQIVTEGHEYRINSIWNGIVGITCLETDFSSHDVSAIGFWDKFRE